MAEVGTVALRGATVNGRLSFFRQFNLNAVTTALVCTRKLIT